MEQGGGGRVAGVEGWPAPGHFTVVSEAVPGEAEEASVHLTDGRALSGRAVRLDCDGRMLEFVPDGEVKPWVVPFSGFKSLQLARPVKLGAVRLAIPAGNIEALPSASGPRFTIRFKDGTELSARIAGVVARGFGLFPYLADEAGSVFRWFMPSDATAGYRIGDPLGKILVERGVLTQGDLDAGLARQRQQRESRFGEYLCRRGLVTPQEVEACLAAQKAQVQRRLGELLVERGLLTAAQRDLALADQETERNMPLGEILVRMGVVSRKAIRQALADQFGLPWVALDGFAFERGVVEAFPAELARRHFAMPLYRAGSRLAVALANPVSWEAVEDIESALGTPVNAVLASREDIAGALGRHYRPA